MPKYLSEEQIKRFLDDGCCFPIDVLSPEDAARYRARLEKAEARYPEELNPTARNNPHYVLPCLDELVHHPVILDAVEDVIGPDILAYGTVLFIKEAGDPAFVSWHQDATYSGIEPQEGVTAWLALSPSTVESGCMRFLPGSHKDSVRSHRDSFGEDNILTRGQEVDGVDESQAVNIELQPGQISLHHARTLHASLPNRSAGRRIGLAIQAYFPPSSRQTKGEDTALLVRGRDAYNHFRAGRRPEAEMTPEARAFRRRVNERWAEILYDGAARKRAY